MSRLTAAIVGAGPAGLFTLDVLLRQAPGVRVDIYERLPTPFGLIRSGVAPDHQGVKAVVRQFDRAFAREEVRLIADCEVGAALPLDRLYEAYDLVFLATGAPLSRRLGVPGEELDGVYPAAAFMAWLNGHPDHLDLDPQVGEQVVIVGGGNVALDVARVLAKTEAEMANSDLCAHARRVTGAARVITLVARALPDQARFTPTEIRALGRLEAAQVGFELPASADLSAPVAAALSALPQGPSAARVRIGFRFGLEAVEVEGRARVERVRFRAPDGLHARVPADTLIVAVGQDAGAAAAKERTYRVGWAAGGRGDIPAARAEAAAAVRRALAETAPEPRNEARANLERWLERRGGGILDWAAWRRIDAVERAAALGARPREKLVSWGALRKAGGLYETE